MSSPHRNTPERRAMLAARAADQRRRLGVAPQMRMSDGSRGWPLKFGWPASMNRHTGFPHEHARAKARRLRQVAA